MAGGAGTSWLARRAASDGPVCVMSVLRSLIAALVLPVRHRYCSLVCAPIGKGTEMGLDHSEQFSRLKRLGEISMRSGQPPLEFIQPPIAPREDHEPGTLQRRSGFDLLHDLIAIQLGQTQIDNHEVRNAGLSRVQPAQGFYSVGKALDLVTRPVQAGLHNLADHRRVTS